MTYGISDEFGIGSLPVNPVNVIFYPLNYFFGRWSWDYAKLYTDDGTPVWMASGDYRLLLRAAALGREY